MNTLKGILDAANKYYPDGYLSNYYDEMGNEKEGEGDTLACFIVREFHDLFNPDTTLEDNIDEVWTATERAIQDLRNIQKGLEELQKAEVKTK